jgi:hypothetical protein
MSQLMMTISVLSFSRLLYSSAAFVKPTLNPSNETPADLNRLQIHGDRPKEAKAAAGTQPVAARCQLMLPAYFDTR